MSTDTISVADDPFADLPLADPSGKALREKIEVLTQRVEDLEGERDELREKVTERDKRIEELEAEDDQLSWTNDRGADALAGELGGDEDPDPFAGLNPEELREKATELSERVAELAQKVEDLEGELDEAQGETIEREAQIVAQDILAAEFGDIVAQLDELFTLRYLPIGLRLAIDEFGRLIGPRAVIYG